MPLYDFSLHVNFYQILFINECAIKKLAKIQRKWPLYETLNDLLGHTSFYEKFASS